MARGSKPSPYNKPPSNGKVAPRGRYARAILSTLGRIRHRSIITNSFTPKLMDTAAKRQIGVGYCPRSELQ
jgi:hypothetical protein